MYLLKIAHPSLSAPIYLYGDVCWSYDKKIAGRFKAEEVIPIYQELSDLFRTSKYTIEIERVED